MMHRRESVNSELWHEFSPHEPVMTSDGLPGVVQAVQDGRFPGQEEYEVLLDGGMGGGRYISSQLTSLLDSDTRQASVATQDYAELNGIEQTPPPQTSIPASAYLSGLLSTLYDRMDALGTTKTAADGGDHTGSAMIALEIPQEVADKVAVTGGLPPEQMHVTLCYVPQASADDLDVMREMADRHAGMLGSLSGTVGGLGQFPEGEDGTPYYVPVDIPHLNDLQGLIETSLKSAGVPVSTDHAFVPHMTLTYLTDGDPDAEPEPVPSTEVTSPGLIVASGDDVWERFPFSGMGQQEKAAGFFSDLMGGGGGGGGQSTLMNYNWCRFRHNNKCFYSKQLDEEHTKQAGYAVWFPQDRGFCQYTSWETQQHECGDKFGMAEPGSNVADGYLDAWQAWDAGGQRGGVPSPGYRNPNAFAARIAAEEAPELSGLDAYNGLRHGNYDQKDAKALTSYQDNDWVDIADAITAGKNHPMMSALDHAISKGTVTAPISVRRLTGPHSTQALFGKPGSRVGQTFTDSRYVSTTADPDRYTKSYNKGSTHLVYHLKPGMHAVGINPALGDASKYQKEHEVLLGRNQQWRIRSDHGRGMNREIHLEAV